MTRPATDSALSRRSLLQAAAAAALSAGALPNFVAAQTPKAAKPSGPIDAHVHIWTPDVEKYPLDADFKTSDMQPPSFTPEELFKECRPVGVQRIVLIQMSWYKFDNRYMLEAIAKHPQTFRGVAIIDEKRDDAPKTMETLLTQGVTGYRLYADRQSCESWLDSSPMQTMWKTAAKTGQAICLLANPDALPAIRKLVAKHPKTRVVIDHFARIGMDGTIRESDLAALCQLAEFPQVYVKTSAYYAMGKKKAPYTDLGPMIERLRDAFGAKRLMWASDSPFQVVDGHTYAESIALVRDKLSFLTEEDKTWMLEKTAESVYWFA